MGFDAHVLKVLIASPSDTTRERDAIEKALYVVSPRYKTRRTPATQQLSSTNSPTAYR